MLCDNVHSMIEKVLKNKEIYLPSDYIKLTKLALQKPNPYQSTVMVNSDFNNYKGVLFNKSIKPGKSKGNPDVKDIRSLKYDPKCQKIYFKLNFDEYQEIPLYNHLRKNIDFNKEVPNLYKRRNVLTLSKWSDLQKFKIVLTKNVHDFYDNVPHEQELKTHKTTKS